MKTEKTVHVIGGINIDIIAQKDKFLKGTSNPSQIEVSIGGVGYNIYKHLKLSHKKFYTVIGEDYLTEILKNELQKIKGSYKQLSQKNSYYLALMESGLLNIGAIDTKVFEMGMTESYLIEILQEIKKGDPIIFDTNLPPQSISCLIKEAKEKSCPLFFETVSVEKTKRCAHSLTDIELMTPTKEELEAIFSSANDDEILKEMEEKRIQNIVLTKGAQGVTHYDLIQNKVNHYSPKKVLNLKNSNSAGDFFFSSLIKNLFLVKYYEESIIKSMEETENYLSQMNQS